MHIPLSFSIIIVIKCDTYSVGKCKKNPSSCSGVEAKSQNWDFVLLGGFDTINVNHYFRHPKRN